MPAQAAVVEASSVGVSSVYFIIILVHWTRKLGETNCKLISETKKE